MALYTTGTHATKSDEATLPGLPQDIWQEIFKCGRHFHDPFERMKFTLLISSVSATWRFFVIQTSLLWSTIAVNHVVTRRLTTPEEGQMGAQSEHFDLVNLFLERSRRSSLDVYVKLTTSNRDKMSTSNVFHHPPPALRGDSKSTVSDLAFVLAPHAPRFRRFHVLSTRYCPVKELLSTLPQVAMPCLQELHIDRVQRTHTQLHSDCPRACHDTMAFLNIQDITKQSAAEYFQDNFPALKSVALSAMPLLLPLFTPRYLTSLKLTLPQFDFVTELKDLLAANASSLENLSFMVAHSLSPLQPTEPFGLVDPDGPLSLPLVKEFSISYADPDTIVPLISSLRLAGVTSLKITNIQKDITYTTDRFFQALSNTVNFGRLDELSLHSVFNDHTRFLRSSSRGCNISRPVSSVYPYCILSHLNALKVLTITNVDLDVLHHLNAAVLPIWRETTSRPMLPLPYLTHLHVAPLGEPADLENLKWFLRERLDRARDKDIRDVPTLRELTIACPAKWAHDLSVIDMKLLADRVLLVSPSRRSRSAGIWDQDIPDPKATELPLTRN